MSKQVTITRPSQSVFGRPAPFPGTRVVYAEEAHLLESAARSLQAAGITGENAGQTGVFVAVEGVCDRWKEEFFRGVEGDGPVGASPLTFPYTSPNALAARLTIAFGLKGHDLTVASGPLSFFKALSSAWTLMAAGAAETALVAAVSATRATTLVMGAAGGLYLTAGYEGFSEGYGGARTVRSMDESLRLFEDAAGSVAEDRGEFTLELRDEWGSRVTLAVGSVHPGV